MNQSQLEMWDKVRETLNERQEVVWNVFIDKLNRKGNSCLTNYTIAEILGVPLHYVTPRTSDLFTKGIVRNTGDKEYNNGNPFTVWELCEVISPPEKTVVLRVTENELGLIIQSLPFRVADDLGNKIRKAYEKFGGKL